MTVVGMECNGEDGPHQILFFQGIFQTSASNCTNIYVVTETLSNFNFLSLKYGVRMMKKKRI